QSDWSTPSFPLVVSGNIQNTSIDNHDLTRVVQDHSTIYSKTKSNLSCKPLQWWSSIPSLLQGMILGVSVGCIILAIILPLWLIQPSKTTTVTPFNKPILRWNTTGITVAGYGSVSGTSSYYLNAPWDVALDWSNTLYVSDRYNHRIQKFLMNTKNGTTVAGQMSATSGSTMDKLNQPTGIYLDINGNLFISDAVNNRIQYWSNGAVTGQTLIGNGIIGSQNNLLYFPYGIWRDASSNILYVADSYNHRIMRYKNNSQSGDIIAGGYGSGIGSTQLSFPYAFHFDSFSNSLLIANACSHNIVRWIIGASNWTIVTGSMNGISGSNATLLSSPTDVTLDPMGNMYVADMFNHRIQFFLSGQSNAVTIAGTGVGGSTSSELYYPSSLTFDSQLNLYVVDQNNHRIQKFVRY
ncbi:unnamed protein product, partial [Adineta steineri]